MKQIIDILVTGRKQSIQPYQAFLSFVILGISLSLGANWQQSLISTNTIAIAELPAEARIVEPRISFEKTVYDLGDVGQGTKNTCEFRFTNTGRGLLKIGNISRTCGCTVFQLDKKEYAPNETGAIKVIYTAGKSTATTQKTIYMHNAQLFTYS